MFPSTCDGKETDRKKELGLSAQGITWLLEIPASNIPEGLYSPVSGEIWIVNFGLDV